MKASARYRSPLDKAVHDAPPREYKTLREALARAGINDQLFQRYVTGERVPAEWLRRQIAEALGVALSELWPGLSKPPRPIQEPRRAPWRLMKR